MTAPEIDSSEGIKIGGVLVKDGSISASRNRSIWLTNPHYTSGSITHDGVALDPNTDEKCVYNTILPIGFLSFNDLHVYYRAGHSGTPTNVVLDITTYYQSLDESYRTHTDTDLANVISTSDRHIRRFTTAGLLSSVDANDIISIEVNRDANNGSDNHNADLEIYGVLIEYTADM